MSDNHAQSREESKHNLTDEIYEKWADQVNALPNGFPRTESGIEIRLLKKISPPEEAWLVGQLSSKMELADEISARLGLPVEEVKEKLETAAHHGAVLVENSGGVDRYRLMPFIPGFWEDHIHTKDHEFAHLYEQYMMLRGAQGIMGVSPPLHRAMPAHQSLKTELILPYEDVRALLLEQKYFWVLDCACRIEQDLTGDRKCDFPLRNCLQFRREGESSRRYDFLEAESFERISQEEALAILDKTEELGLVHSIHNNAKGLGYMCNCCGCCCCVLRPILEWGIENSMAKANYYAAVDTEECEGCEACIDRCQVGAMSMKDDVAMVELSRCLGCGVCVTGCPSDAVQLHKKPDAELILPPSDFKAWGEERLRNRGLIK